MSAAPAPERRPPAPPVEAASPPLTVVRPSRGWTALRLDELWQYRELLFFLACRDVKVRCC